MSVLTLAEIAAATAGRLCPAESRGPITSVSIDSRTLAPGALFVAIEGARFDGHDFAAAAAARGAVAALVRRPTAVAGLPVIEVADTTRALADLARHVRLRRTLPLLAITGSVGKTTTKEMAATLLECLGPVLRTEGNLNNHYGLPLTLLRLRDEHVAAVVELGMSAAGEIAALSRLASPDVAVITRVAPVHLEFFPSVDAIAEAKAEILQGLRPGGTAVLNADDPRLLTLGRRHAGPVVWFGMRPGADVFATALRIDGGGTRFELCLHDHTAQIELPLLGPHFVANFVAAAAAAHALGAPAASIAERARALRPSRHRGELRRLGGGVILLDDSYNSSPAALEAALETLALVPARRRVALLGDMLELGARGPELHRERGRALAGAVDLVVGVGPLSRQLLDGAAEAGLAASALHHFETAQAARESVVELIGPGDAVLVKASRGMRLEVLVEALVERFGDEAP